MKIAVISDIHSNLEALSTCIEYIEKQEGVNYIAALGDIIGYGSDPSECISIIRNKTEFSILGNHDSAVAGITETSYFNYAARSAVMWTKGQLSDDEIDYIRSLPYSENRDSILFVHSSPGQPEEWKYVFHEDDFTEEFQYLSEMICFIGHTHIPGIYSDNGKLPHSNGPVNLDPKEKYIINVGSVGQPRDGDPRCSFGIFDNEEDTFEIIRLEYDALKTREKIIDRGLPDYLGERLLMGR
ncbi:metallophosphoesterase family protein [candidate division KSB1 bacterium]